MPLQPLLQMETEAPSTSIDPMSCCQYPRLVTGTLFQQYRRAGIRNCQQKDRITRFSAGASPCDVARVAVRVRATQNHLTTLRVVRVAVQPEGEHRLSQKTLVEHHVEGRHSLFHSDLRKAHTLQSQANGKKFKSSGRLNSTTPTALRTSPLDVIQKIIVPECHQT